MNANLHKEQDFKSQKGKALNTYIFLRWAMAHLSSIESAVYSFKSSKPDDETTFQKLRTTSLTSKPTIELCQLDHTC